VAFVGAGGIVNAPIFEGLTISAVLGEISVTLLVLPAVHVRLRDDCIPIDRSLAFRAVRIPTVPDPKRGVKRQSL
jgi:hypothetical protein